jgi:hypothetical protein
MKKTYQLKRKGFTQTVDAKSFKKLVLKYQHSPLGKETRKKWLLKNKEKYRAYNIEYCRIIREESKKLGLCCRCHKRKAIKDKSICKKCKTEEKR